MRLSTKLLLLLPATLLLAGCAATTLPEFEAAQTDRDVVPASAQADIDADTTRFVGEVEGAEIYLARGVDDTLCLIHIRDDEWEQMGCGAGLGVGSTLESGTRLEAGTFRFPEQQIGEGTREPLSESVTVIFQP